LLFLLPHISNAAPQRTIIFELEPAYVTADRKPAPEWLSQFSTRRDDSGVLSSLEAVNWHSRAENHPLLRGIFSLQVPDGESPEVWLRQLEAATGVAWAEPSPVRYTCAFTGKGRDDSDAPPNDPYYPLQWSLHKVHAPAAWDISRGDTNVVIAIVDVGVDIDHGDLRGKSWVNRAEMNGDPGVDDDGNGFSDDVYGWDFVDNDSDPRPGSQTDSHGTHVAGIAAAATDNGYGIAGMGWNCRFMAVRTGFGTIITHGYEGVVYATASGADIINLSWGSDDPSNVERLTVEYAAEQGALVVGAAGNISARNFDHYPGAYEHAMAVAAVTDGDRLAYFSNFGEFVNICAPGDTIISTVPGRYDGFGLLSGTSMATPLVAGAAGLLKAIHPDWSPKQLMLQLMNTADPVDNQNPEYPGMMGTGRLNVFRALFEDRSGFELTVLALDDSTEGNGNGVIDPDEDILIKLSITNMLTRPANVSGRIVCDDNYITIEHASFDFGEVGPDETNDNSDNPFRASISRSARAGRIFKCELRLSGSDVIDQAIPFTIVVRSPYADHNNGSVALTVTDFGALGYWDYWHGEDVGNSFRYSRNNFPSLYHGSLVIAAPPNRVSDCAYGDSTRSRFDFVTTGQGMVVRYEEPDMMYGHAEFEDTRAERPLNLTVYQDSYSFSDPPDDDYIIVSYDIINNGSTIDSLYVGLFLDWDVIQADGNLCLWNEENQVGWMEYVQPNWPLYGAGVLDNAASFHVAAPNYVVMPGSGAWSDQTKMSKILTGFSEAESDEIGDWTHLIGSGPFHLGQGYHVVVTFAILAGDYRDDLFANIAAARDRWNAFEDAIRSDHVPSGFRLIAAYPSPFNSNIKITCSTDMRGLVTWSLFDPTGRLVIPGGGFFTGAGHFTLPIDAAGLPSGCYMVRLRQAGHKLIVPVTLVR